VLSVPRGVEVRKVDLAVEMQILAFHVSRRHDRVASDATGKVFR
jgi:redox-sensing transcriptional repressor